MSHPKPTLLANREDKANAADGYIWLVADADGNRLAYHRTRIVAAAEANTTGGNAYQITGNELRPFGSKRSR